MGVSWSSSSLRPHILCNHNIFPPKGQLLQSSIPNSFECVTQHRWGASWSQNNSLAASNLIGVVISFLSPAALRHRLALNNSLPFFSSRTTWRRLLPPPVCLGSFLLWIAMALVDAIPSVQRSCEKVSRTRRCPRTCSAHTPKPHHHSSCRISSILRPG